MKIHIPIEKLDRSVFTDADIDAVRGIIATRGEFKGYMRASKPDFRKHPESAYVWRMLAFYLGIDASMPVMAAAYIWRKDIRDEAKRLRRQGPGQAAAAENLERVARDWEKNRRKELDLVVETLLDFIPKNQWLGVKRWGNVLYGPGTFK